MTEQLGKPALNAGDSGALGGKPYRPSNSDEGFAFEAHFCDRCERERHYRENDTTFPACGIHTAALAFSINDTAFPKEWITDAQGDRCTAFVEEGKPLPEVYERDRLRYEAAMAEMRASKDLTP